MASGGNIKLGEKCEKRENNSPPPVSDKIAGGAGGGRVGEVINQAAEGQLMWRNIWRRS
jgi:hypothetical protein